MNKDTKKTLEDVMREKFATGYDPIKLQASMKANNEENLVVTIEGHVYSVRDNRVELVEKKAHVAQTAGTDKVEPAAGNAEGGASGSTESSSPTSDAGTPSTEAGAPLSFEDRATAIVNAYGAEKLVATNDDTAKTYGDIIYDVVDADQETLASGTLVELETAVENAKASQANTEAA